MSPADLAPVLSAVPAQALTTLVDHRRVQTLEKYELSILETLEATNQVSASYSDLVLTNMLRGRKVLHLGGPQTFQYLPGHTMVVPPHLKMLIDFPEASLSHPTQCVALAIDRLQVIDTVNYLNEFYPRPGHQPWRFDFQQPSFHHDDEVTALLYKLVRIGFGPGPHKDVLADFTVRELLLRLMQLQSLREVEQPAAPATSSRLAHTLQYIREHLSEKISVDELSAHAAMSKPSFHRAFKQEFGFSPLDYILKERMRLAKRCLKDPALSITEVCYEAGFNNLTYFTRMFRQLEGLTPTEYRVLCLAAE